MPDVDAVLADARMPERTVPVCLRGDLQAEVEAVERQITQSLGDDRLAGKRAAYADQIDELRARMQAHTLTLTFRALPKRQWRDLEATHPPRKTDDGEPVGQDGQLGFNVDAVIEAAVPRCLADPAMQAGQVERLLDAITDGQYNEIARAVFEVNKNRVSVPFSVLASAARRDSGENSTQPARGESPDAGSTDSNRDPRLGTPTTSTGG